MKEKIMYLEQKGAESGTEARIGRVKMATFSRVISYKGKQYQPHKARDAHANYYEIGTGTWFWITHCQKDGLDSLEPRTVIVDDDVQQEYWAKIRLQPDSVGKTRYQSPGKSRA